MRSELNSEQSGQNRRFLYKLKPYFSDSVKLFLLSFAVRLIVFYFSEGIHADAVSRVLLSLAWLKDPEYIMCNTWGPFHYYLIALFIFIFNDHITAPVFINLILGSLTVVYIYRFSRDLYGSRSGAVLAALVFCFTPLVVRQSIFVLAGTPLVFCLSVSFFYVLKAIHNREGEIKFALLAGLFYALASGFRFESWILLPVVAAIATFSLRWKMVLVFVLVASIFPLIWLSTCNYDTGDALYSFHQSASWNINIAGVNDNVTREQLIQRAVFIPAVLGLNLSPILLIWLIAAMIIAFRKRSLALGQIIWIVPFCFLFAVLEYKTFTGDVNLHPRYANTLIFLFCPHLALIMPKLNRRITIAFVIIIAGNIALSYRYDKTSFEDVFRFNDEYYEAVKVMRRYMFSDQQFIPALSEPEIKTVSAVINKSMEARDGLLIDFISWDGTYYVMLHSGLLIHEVLVIYTDVLKNSYNGHMIRDYMVNKNKGLMLVRKGSSFHNYSLKILAKDAVVIEGDTIPADILINDDRYILFKYRYPASPGATGEPAK